MDKAIKIVAEFISKDFLDENNTNFLEEKISKLEEKIKLLIYIEILKTCYGKEYKQMRNYIYDIFLNKLDDIDNIIKLINSLYEDDKKNFLEKLLKKCEFTKEEFYSISENKKMKLLCSLNETGRLNILGYNNKYIEKLMNLLDDIRDELENGSIYRKLLETFLNLKKEESEKEIILNKNEIKVEKKNDEIKDGIIIKNQEKVKNNTSKEEIIKQKLGLIKIVLCDYNPMEKYEEFKNKINKINKKLDKLNSIKDSLEIFHKSQYKDVIREISNINNIESLREFRTEEMIKKIDKLFIKL